MKSKRQEKANQFNSRGSLVDISRFEFFNYLIKISHEIWSHYNTEFRPYNTLPTKVQRSNRNRAKLGRALHKLRSSFAVNPRYKFHHFFEPCYCSFLQNLLINYREFTYTPVCNCKLKGKMFPSGFSIGTTLRGQELTQMSKIETIEPWPFEKIHFLLFFHTNFYVG